MWVWQKVFGWYKSPNLGLVFMYHLQILPCTNLESPILSCNHVCIHPEHCHSLLPLAWTMLDPGNWFGHTSRPSSRTWCSPWCVIATRMTSCGTTTPTSTFDSSLVKRSECVLPSQPRAWQDCLSVLTLLLLVRLSQSWVITISRWNNFHFKSPYLYYTYITTGFHTGFWVGGVGGGDRMVAWR